jgi:hypothetical protein
MNQIRYILCTGGYGTLRTMFHMSTSDSQTLYTEKAAITLCNAAASLTMWPMFLYEDVKSMERWARGIPEPKHRCVVFMD